MKVSPLLPLPPSHPLSSGRSLSLSPYPPPGIGVVVVKGRGGETAKALLELQLLGVSRVEPSLTLPQYALAVRRRHSNLASRIDDMEVND